MNSVVRITSCSPDEYDQFGTGFIVHRDAHAAFVLTCAHVVKNVGGPGNIKADGHPAVVFASGVEVGVDLAILHVEESLDMPTLGLRVCGKEQIPFRTVGFQSYGGDLLLEPIQGTLGEQVWLETKKQGGRVRGWNLEIDDGRHPQPGYSGSPVIDERSGEVIGVISHWKGDGPKGLALSVEALKRIWSGIPPDLLKPQLPIGGSPVVVQYDIAAIRSLTRDAFTPKELWRFCQDRPALRPVLDDFAWNASLNDMIDVLMEYCEKRVLFFELLSEIRECNPRQYQRYRAQLGTVKEAVELQPGPQRIPPENSVGIYVVNEDLSINHFMCVTPNMLGWQLDAQVRAILALPDNVSAVGGRLGLRFKYMLLHAGLPLSELSPLTRAGVGEGSTVNLQVAVEQFGPGKASIPVEYRPAETPGVLSSRMKRRLIIQAFDHLWPQEKDSFRPLGFCSPLQV